MFALLSNSSEYSAKIKPFIALAPVTTLGYTKSELLRAAAEVPFLETYLHDFPGPFIISDYDIHLLSKLFCKHKLDLICLNFIFLLSGYDEPMINRTRLQVYYQHTPAGTSNWAILHYLQLVRSKKFAKMDFGRETNLVKYGQVSVWLGNFELMIIICYPILFLLIRKFRLNIHWKRSQILILRLFMAWEIGWQI